MESYDQKTEAKLCTQAHPSFEKEMVGTPWQGKEGGKFLSVWRKDQYKDFHSKRILLKEAQDDKFGAFDLF